MHAGGVGGMKISDKLRVGKGWWMGSDLSV